MEPRSKTMVLHPLVGRTLKHYRVDAVLGQGGMGVVYRAHDLKLQRSIAVKLLTSELTADPERRKRFLLEARAAARISHPAIAQVYDVDEHEGAIFIAMELVEGRTVRELIQNRELDLLGAIEIAIQVAGGLAKAHEAGIIHRDIKPANVILTPDGHAKILDFGIAKLMDPEASTLASAQGITDLSTLTQTLMGAIKGTPSYMSPEQVKGEAVDARSDLFSLGVMLFEMAVGETPFRRATLMETMQAVAFGDTPSVHALRPGLPTELERIVSRCLQKRPENRYADARVLLEDLRALRRDTESRRTQSHSLREWMGDAFDQLTHLKPSQYRWIALGVLAVGAVVYLLTSDVGLAGFLFFVIAGLFIYRHVRNQPQRMFELFVRQVAKLPEVRLIVQADRKITVVVDRAAGQLYRRINDRLNRCNRKLFFGHPYSVVIRPDLTAEEFRQLLAGPGIQYLRDKKV